LCELTSFNGVVRTWQGGQPAQAQSMQFSAPLEDRYAD